jgi:hypothetical protein
MLPSLAVFKLLFYISKVTDGFQYITTVIPRNMSREFTVQLLDYTDFA